MTAHADLAEVRAALDLAAKATPGPWSSTTSPMSPAGGLMVFDIVSVRRPIATTCGDTDDAIEEAERNAAAIVALRNAAPAIAAAVEELERLRTAVDEREGDMHLRIRAGYDKTVADAWRAVVAKRDAEIAALERQVCRLVSGQEIDGDRLCQHHGADVAALALLSDERAAHAETSRDLDALLTALGAQVTPGGQTLAAGDARRVADGMRRARELVAAREVPADVEAAIDRVVSVATRDGMGIDASNVLTAKPSVITDSARADLRAAIAKAIADAEERGRTDDPSAPSDVEVAISDLVEASRDLEIYAAGKVTAKRTKSAEAEFERARTAMRTAIAAEIERARAEGRAWSTAAPATVGGLLASDLDGSVVEWMDDGSWYRYGDSLWVDYWSTFEGRWLPDDGPIWPSILSLPARLVPASEADADPASRGPIGGGS